MYIFSKILYRLHDNIIYSKIKGFIKDSKLFYDDMDVLIENLSIPDKDLQNIIVSKLSKINASSQKVVPLELYKTLAGLAHTINQHQYFQEAISVYLSCLSILADLPDERDGLADVLKKASEPYYRLGYFKKAMKLLKYAYLIYWKKDQTIYMANIIVSMGDYYNLALDHKQALAYYNKALIVYEKEKMLSDMAKINHTIAIIMLKKGKSEECFKYLNKACRQAETGRDLNLTYEILLKVVDIYMLKDKLKIALETVNHALNIAENINEVSKGKLIHCHQKRAEINILLSEFECANDDLCTALNYADLEPEDHWAISCLLTYAKMLIFIGDMDGAKDCLSSVEDIKEVSNLHPEQDCKYFLYLHKLQNSVAKNDDNIQILESFISNDDIIDYEKFDLLFTLVDHMFSKGNMAKAKEYLSYIMKMLLEIHNPSYLTLYYIKLSKVYYFKKSDSKERDKEMKQKALDARQKAISNLQYSSIARVHYLAHYSYGRYLLKNEEIKKGLEEFKKAVEVIVNIANKVPENFEKINYYKNPEIKEILFSYIQTLKKCNEQMKAIELVHLLKIQDLNLI